MISEGAFLKELSEELIQLIIEIASVRKQTCADVFGKDGFYSLENCGVSL